MFLNRLLLLAAFLLGAQQLKSQAAGSDSVVTLTLQQAIDFAMKNSPSLANTQMDVAAANQKVKEIRAIGLPQINASASFSQYGIIPGSWISNVFSGGAPGAPDYIFLRFQQKYAASVGIQLNQLLFDGSYLVGLKAASEYVNMSSLLTAKSEYDIQVNVTKAYLMALSTAKNMSSLDQNIKTLEKSLEDVRALNKEGFAEKLDVQKLELTVSNLKLSRQRVESAVEITLNVLKMNMGMDINTPLKLSQNLEELNASVSINNAALSDTTDIRNRFEYKLLQQNLKLSYLDEKRYKAQYLPSVVGFMSGQRATNRSQFNFFEGNLTPNNNFVPSTMMGLQVSIPIFDGLKKQSQIQQVKLNRIKTQNDLRNLGLAANMEYQNARNSYLLNVSQVNVAERNVKLAEEIFEKASIKYKEGVGSALEITQAQNDLKTAQTNYLNALYDLVLSKVDIKKALGEKLF